VKRSLCLAGTALGLLPLSLGVATAAAGGKPARPVAKVACRTSLAITVASGASSVTPPVQKGDEFGSAACNKLFGSGVQADAFTVRSGGNSIGKYTLYFSTGTIHGTYDLTPQEGSLNFLSVDETGPMTVMGGTGTYQGAKGTGTMTCRSQDGIHTKCVDRLKLAAS
jgi:hypothetical protein